MLLYVSCVMTMLFSMVVECKDMLSFIADLWPISFLSLIDFDTGCKRDRSDTLFNYL